MLSWTVRHVTLRASVDRHASPVATLQHEGLERELNDDSWRWVTKDVVATRRHRLPLDACCTRHELFLFGIVPFAPCCLMLLA
mmetsp:Transcript_102191/g.274429  ORF Transcript_102191/g.274429 Transcript_102191/m.274429 type:complete len:83 (-) Transcript_102191:7-255(-)